MNDQNFILTADGITPLPSRIVALEHQHAYELFMCAYLRFLNQGTL